uniref:Secreted protein n=1 Tax=Mesocestoides corti TaxID=53468 RepID=A0A5K3G3J5_MESCO
MTSSVLLSALTIVKSCLDPAIRPLSSGILLDFVNTPLITRDMTIGSRVFDSRRTWMPRSSLAAVGIRWSS